MQSIWIGDFMDGDERGPQLKVHIIETGVVIDHIPHGIGLMLYEALNVPPHLPEGHNAVLAVGLDSEKMGRKDIIKYSGAGLSDKRYKKVKEITPDATINEIADYTIKRKVKAKDL